MKQEIKLLMAERASKHEHWRPGPQGALLNTLLVLRKLGVNGVEIRQRADSTTCLDGIILPGGESTVMGKLLRELELYAPIRDAIAAGMPVLRHLRWPHPLAERAEKQRETYFALMDITVRRNAYGRQLAVPHTTDITGIGRTHGLHPRTFHQQRRLKPCLATVNGQSSPPAQQNMLGDRLPPRIDRRPQSAQLLRQHDRTSQRNCCQQQTA